MAEQSHNEVNAFKAFQQGDERGLDFFFNHYFSPLSYYSQSLTKQHEASKEIVSDAFIKLWAKREAIDDCKKVRPLLYKMVHDASVDFVRANQREQKHLAALYVIADITDVPYIENVAETETYHRVYTLLQTLPPRSRQIFRMFYFQNKAIKQIASELGVSVNTVKTQKLRAIQMLKSSLLPRVLLVLFSSFFI